MSRINAQRSPAEKTPAQPGFASNFPSEWETLACLQRACQSRDTAGLQPSPRCHALFYKAAKRMESEPRQGEKRKWKTTKATGRRGIYCYQQRKPRLPSHTAAAGAREGPGEAEGKPAVRPFLGGQCESQAERPLEVKVCDEEVGLEQLCFWRSLREGVLRADSCRC